MKKGKRKLEKGYLITVGVLSFFLLIGYYSYALFTIDKQEKKTISIKTGTLSSTLTSQDSSFQNNQVTLNANETKTLTITLTNNNQRNAKFNFYYVTPIPAGVTVMYLENTPNIPPEKAGKVINQGKSESYLIEIKNTTGSSVTVKFGSDAGLENKDLTFPSNGKVLEEKPKGLDNSGANLPELGETLIPVVFDEQSKVWKKANIGTKGEWYDYEEQRWANAVVVTPDSYESKYKSAPAGTKVDIDADILQMYVWIPRYSYVIQGTYGKKEAGRTDDPTKELPGEIDVKFIGTTDKDTGTGQYESNTPTDSDWYTPDAFTLSGKELSGLWVGKFETGYSGATSSSNAEKNTSTESSKVIIKPNVYSWRSISVSNIYNTVKGITAASTFGLSRETYDSHAMKNNEWGAVAYLSQSKYGKYGNSEYTGANREIYINDSSNYLTGRSSGQPSASGYSEEGASKYDDIVNQGSGKGQKGGGASTTGNVYGIYDMSGGAWEFVMGNYDGYTDSSGFSGNKGEWYTSNEDYINFYTSTSSKDTQYKSHAIGETETWYGDYNGMVSSSSSWFNRSGSYDVTGRAGIFYYGRGGGIAASNGSFRVVLTLK